MRQNAAYLLAWQIFKYSIWNLTSVFSVFFAIPTALFLLFLSSTVSDDSCSVSWSQSEKPSEQWKKNCLFSIYRGVYYPVMWGLFHKPFNKDSLSNNQDTMESRRVFLTVAGPCQVFIETPDGSGNQLQGTPARVAGKRNEPERFYTVCQRFPLESFHPKRSD